MTKEGSLHVSKESEAISAIFFIFINGRGRPHPLASVGNFICYFSDILRHLSYLLQKELSKKLLPFSVWWLTKTCPQCPYLGIKSLIWPLKPSNLWKVLHLCKAPIYQASSAKNRLWISLKAWKKLSGISNFFPKCPYLGIKLLIWPLKPSNFWKILHLCKAPIYHTHCAKNRL